MIVKNEQDLLEDCLLSTIDFVNEIVIVDTGSSDGTITICERYGAKIFTYPWDNSFSNARNYSIEKAGHEWLLLLDADERLVQEDGPKLLNFVRTTTFDGAHFKVYNFVGNKAGGQYTLHNALRLLKNNGIYRFKGNIHEQITRTDGKSLENSFAITDIRLHHLGYLDSITIRKDKRNRNIPILLKELEKEPENSFTLFNIGNEYMAQKDYMKALELYGKAQIHYNRHEAYAPHLLFRMALCYYNLEMYTKAIDTLNEGLNLFPGCTDMEFLKGSIYMSWRRDTLAINSFEKAIAMGEPHPTLRFSDGCGTTRPFLSLALIYERQHDYERAAACYTKAIATNKELYSALYGVAKCLKKMMWKPADIEVNLSKFFSDLTYVPNRILLIDILLSQRLCLSCTKHLDFFENIEGFEVEKDLLSGKYYFYTKQYAKACDFFLKILKSKKSPRVLVHAERDGALLLFATLLIINPDDMENVQEVIEAVGKGFGRPGELICRQIQVIWGNRDKNLLEGEDPQGLLTFFSNLLRVILHNNEFDLFEKLLHVYNYIDSPQVLLSLADIYMESGFPQLAASTVLRSIKELDTINVSGACLLADALSIGKIV